jgi:DNA-binding LacI/PurR family transcriptional regulator
MDGEGVRASGVSRAAIGDVAARAGVSIATVSRVLNGRPDVAPATREMVMRHVRDLGYARSRNARALAGKRTGLIGLLVPFAQNNYFSAIIEGAGEAAYERDARLVLCPTHHRKDREASMLDQLMHSDTDGSLLIAPLESLAELRQLQRLGSPFVVIDPSMPLDEDIPVMSAANWAGARRATEYLISLGHTRIGVITGPGAACASVDRLAGYHSALHSAGLPIMPDYVREGDFAIDGGYGAALELLALPNAPTAIFAMNDNMAVGVLHAARARNLRVPDDLSVVGFDDVDVAMMVTPTLTTISQPLQEMGRLAITVLYRQINGQPLDANRIELSTKLIVRGSTAPCPATSFLTY